MLFSKYQHKTHFLLCLTSTSATFLIALDPPACNSEVHNFRIPFFLNLVLHISRILNFLKTFLSPVLHFRTFYDVWHYALCIIYIFFQIRRKHLNIYIDKVKEALINSELVKHRISPYLLSDKNGVALSCFRYHERIDRVCHVDLLYKLNDC